ncbi:hypothetical protein ACIBL5_37450 [Streptomyces sp. NPDC050516]|uniref:hypothetical protein n=1 Tax=Streptomyces sp. NPDC050516 TaxID=3365621 RepID=UPI0037AF9B14
MYYLTLAVLERRAPLAVTGEVLRMEPRRREQAPRFLALDTGDGDRTAAWALPPGAPAVAPGQRGTPRGVTGYALGALVGRRHQLIKDGDASKKLTPRRR